MLGLIPRPFYPHFIVINKLAFVLLAPNVMTFIAHIPYPVKKHVKTFSVEATDTNNNQVVQLSMAYRIFLILNELSFSMHLTNYLFVQYNFLSSRILFDTSIYAFVSMVFKLQFDLILIVTVVPKDHLFHAHDHHHFILFPHTFRGAG